MTFSRKSTGGPGFGKELQRWTECHAAAVGVALLGVLSGLPLAWFPAVAAVSFAVLIGRFRARWTPAGRFGAANAITLFRLAGIFLLLSLSGPDPAWVAAVALGLFALDAADGWVARRSNLSSEFGEFFDKEADAFFLLALGLLLYVDRRLEVWVLIPGLLRYLFVAYLKFTGTRQIKEERSRFGCWSYFLMILSMISAFVTRDTLYAPLIFIMTCVLCLSFADTIRRLHDPSVLQP